MYRTGSLKEVKDNYFWIICHNSIYLTFWLSHILNKNLKTRNYLKNNNSSRYIDSIKLNHLFYRETNVESLKPQNRTVDKVYDSKKIEDNVNVEIDND